MLIASTGLQKLQKANAYLNLFSAAFQVPPFLAAIYPDQHFHPVSARTFPSRLTGNKIEFKFDNKFKQLGNRPG